MVNPVLIVVVFLGLVLASCAAAVAYLFALRRAERQASAKLAAQSLSNESLQVSIDTAVQSAVAAVRDQATAERDAAVSAALEQSAVLQREQLVAKASQVQQHASADLASKKDVIDDRLEQVHSEMRSELTKLTDMVNALGRTNAEKFGQVETSLKAHADVAAAVAESAQALRTAIANPQARGQWGERMAEDVLRMAGFIENVNYTKQGQIDGLAALHSAHGDRTEAALENVRRIAVEHGNLFAELMEAVKSCSLGQLTEAMFEVGGAYRRNM